MGVVPIGLSVCLCLFLTSVASALMDSEQNYVQPAPPPYSSAESVATPPGTRFPGGSANRGQCENIIPYGRVFSSRIWMKKVMMSASDEDHSCDVETADPVFDKQSEEEKKESKDDPAGSPSSEETLITSTTDRYIVKAVPKRAPKAVAKAPPKTVPKEVPKEVKQTQEVDAVEEKETEKDVDQIDSTAIDPEPTTSTDPHPEAKNKTGADQLQKLEEEPQVVANDTAKDKDIPSFSEWAENALKEQKKKEEEEKRRKEEEKEKKKKLQQQQQQQQQHQSFLENTTTSEVISAPVKPMKKNFAGLDCGAKVISANPESQGASNVISTSRDEYMLNKCSDQIWFVVELCESIKGLKVELANFELFSSLPHEFTVTMGNSYPPRGDKDWAEFGHFFATDQREVQTFTSEGVFGKYAKVEILSHHGSEHFCPISHFKIFGISEIELMGVDEDDDDDEEHHPLAHVDVETAMTTASTKSNGIVSYIKEKVDETIERFVGVFRPRRDNDMSTALNENSLTGNSFSHVITCPHCDLERQRDVYFLLTSSYNQLRWVLEIQALREAMENGVCQSLGFDGKQLRGTTCKGSRLMEFYRTLFGTSRAIALCNALAVENDQLPMAESQASWEEDGVEAKCSTNQTKVKTQAGEEDLGNLSEFKEAVAPLKKEETNDVTEGVNEHEKKGGESFKDSSVDSGSPAVVTSPVKDGASHATATVGDPEEKSENNDTESTDDAQPPAEEVKEMKNPPPVIHVTPSPPSESKDSKQQQPQQQSSNGGTGSSSAPAQRESVWQKFSNKIKNLEQNVALSSGYLEELSVRYKKQIEDLQMSVRQANVALMEAADDRQQNRRDTAVLREKLDNISTIVEEVTSQLETISAWAIGFHAVFLVVEMVIGFFFLFLCYLGYRRTLSASKGPRPVPTSSTPLQSTKKSLQEQGRNGGPARPVRRSGTLAIFSRAPASSRRSSSDSKGSSAREGPSALSRRQKKRLQRRMNKRVEDLPSYHTYHAGNNVAAARPPRLRRTSSADQVRDLPLVEEALNATSAVNSPSRFRVSPVPLPLENKFGLLNNSVHEDESSPARILVNGDHPAAVGKEEVLRHRPRPGHRRSRSTSPHPKKSARQRLVFKQQLMVNHK